jgi:hypothetical protein
VTAPQVGAVVLCCSPQHLDQQLTVWPLAAPAKVQRIDPETKAASWLQASYLAACPACLAAAGGNPMAVLARVRGHFTWGSH